VAHREQRQAQKLVNDRVASINKVLRVTCVGSVEACPTGALRWQIVPTWKRPALPIRCDGLILVFYEEIVVLPTNLGVRLICERFKYTVEATKNLTDHRSRTVPVGWHFRYERDDKGPQHSFMTACVANAIKQATNRRLPLYHMHVAEKSNLSDDLHYPIGEPVQPLDLVFEILRLVKDEFVPS